MKKTLLIALYGLASLVLFGAPPKPPDWREPIRPKFVLGQAAQDFASLPEKERVESREEFCREFTDGFFRGYTSPAAGIAWTAKKGGSYRGFYAGQKYLKDHPDSLARVMGAYGYEEVTVVGRWYLGFEECELHLDARDSHSPWSLEQIFDVLPHTKDDRVGVHLVATLQVHGFLSPIGHYGHMARYEREIHIVSASVKEANQAAQTTPGLRPSVSDL